MPSDHLFVDWPVGAIDGYVQYRKAPIVLARDIWDAMMVGAKTISCNQSDFHFLMGLGNQIAIDLIGIEDFGKYLKTRQPGAYVFVPLEKDKDENELGFLYYKTPEKVWFAAYAANLPLLYQSYCRRCKLVGKAPKYDQANYFAHGQGKAELLAYIYSALKVS